MSTTQPLRLGLTFRDSPSPSLPVDSRAQAAGRQGEAAVVDALEGHGWIVLRNGPDSDFGVDLAVFKRSDDRFVLPYALSVQVKTVNKAALVGTDVTVRVKSSSFSSWLWSNTPTVCIVLESSSGRMWWSTPVASPAVSLDRPVKSRRIVLDRALQSSDDWRDFDAQAVELWAHHASASVVLDLPLVLQVLTDVANETDLWTNAGGTSSSLYHAAAVHAYRTVAGLNAVVGRTGSVGFLELSDTAAPEQGCLSYGHGLVSRGDTTLGVISSIEWSPWSEWLLEVFGTSGHELATIVPRLQKLGRMPELGIPPDLVAMVSRIGRQQLAIIDPELAKSLTPDDFTQLADHPENPFPDAPEIHNEVARPLARALPGAMRFLGS